MKSKDIFTDRAVFWKNLIIQRGSRDRFMIQTENNGFLEWFIDLPLGSPNQKSIPFDYPLCTPTSC